MCKIGSCLLHICEGKLGFVWGAVCLGFCLSLLVVLGKLFFLNNENKLDISGIDYMFSLRGVKSGRA